MSSTPLVSIVYLSHDRPQFMVQSLDSLQAQTYAPLEKIIVNNRSPKTPEIEQIVSRYTGLKRVFNETNLGFTGGMNSGVAAAQGEYLYITEDDIVLDPSCISELVTFFQATSRVGLLAPVMYNIGAKTIRSAGGKVRLGGVYGQSIIGADEMDHGQYAQPFKVNFIAGAAIFCRRQLFDEVGRFRDDFFIYYDDVDLCQKVLRRGLDIYVVPSARVHHFEPPPAEASPEIEYHKVKNLFAVYLLHARASAWPEFFARYGLWLFLKNPNRRLLSRRLRAWTWLLRKTPQFLRERRGMGPILPA